MPAATSSWRGPVAELIRGTLKGHRLETEYWSFIISLPVALAFVPDYSKNIAAGFDALGHAPQWYKLALEAIVAYAFGRTALSGVRTLSLKQPPKESP